MAKASSPPRQTAPDSIDKLRAAATGCRACDLWERATQTVFGEGAEAAEIMLVGEQPGDREDRAGAPFVGPAGELLDRALMEAGIDRRAAYVTNVVKHFKWRPRGKRRIHVRPNTEEITPATRGSRRRLRESGRRSWSAWERRRRRRSFVPTTG